MCTVYTYTCIVLAQPVYNDVLCWFGLMHNNTWSLMVCDSTDNPGQAHKPLIPTCLAHPPLQLQPLGLLGPYTHMFRVGQNHIYIGWARTIYFYVSTVYIRYFWQGNHHTCGHIRCVYTVLANPGVYIQYYWHGNHQIFGVYIRLWPTLHMYFYVGLARTVYTHRMWPYIRTICDRIYTPYVTVYLVISLPRIPYIWCWPTLFIWCTNVAGKSPKTWSINTVWVFGSGQPTIHTCLLASRIPPCPPTWSG